MEGWQSFFEGTGGIPSPNEKGDAPSPNEMAKVLPLWIYLLHTFYVQSTYVPSRYLLCTSYRPSNTFCTLSIYPLYTFYFKSDTTSLNEKVALPFLMEG